MRRWAKVLMLLILPVVTVWVGDFLLFFAWRQNFGFGFWLCCAICAIACLSFLICLFWNASTPVLSTKAEE